MTTTTIGNSHGAHDTRPSAIERLSRYIGDFARIFRAAREVERLMQLSDAQLERRGLRRDEIVSRTYAAYLDVA